MKELRFEMNLGSFIFFARYTRSIMRKDGLFYGNPTADD